MTLILCLDAGRGSTFFGKRQTTDSAVRERMINIAGEKPLSVNAYTASQFRDHIENIAVTDDILSLPDDAVCFVEDADPALFSGRVDRLVIYRWNKKYPRDRALGFYPYDEGMKLESIQDFAGSSHDRVTEEIWVKTSGGKR